MKKSVLYLLALLALGAITYYLITKKDTAIHQNADFSIQDTADISKIFLADITGNKIILRRNEKGWSVNDSFLASPIRVWNVLDVMMNARPTQPVPSDMLKTAASNLSGYGIKVEVYNLANEKIRDVIIGGSIPSGVGNYGKVAQNPDAYIYSIPEFDADLYPNLDLDLLKWRDRAILSVSNEEFKEVSINYSRVQDSTYTLTKLEQGYQINHSGNTFPADLKRSKLYSDEFKKISCVGFINDLKEKDSIFSNGTKFGDLIVRKQNGKQDSLALFYFAADQRVKKAQEIENVVMDMEYLFATDGKDAFILNTNKFAQVLKQPSYFKSK